MKKLIIALLALTALSACKNSENDEATPAPTIIGTWKTSSVNYKKYSNDTLKSDTTYLPPYVGSSSFVTSEITFTKDSAFIRTSSWVNPNSYQINGNQITLSRFDSRSGFTAINTLTVEALTNTDLSLFETHKGSLKINTFTKLKRQ